MRKLLFIAGRLTPIAGEEKSVCLLCNALACMEHFDISIASLDNGYSALPLDERIKTTYLIEKAKSRFMRFIYLLKMVRRSDYDLIIGYGFSARIPAGVIGRFVKTPVIYCERLNPQYKGFPLMRRLKQHIGVMLVHRKKNSAVFQSRKVMEYYSKFGKKTIIPNILDTANLPDTTDYHNRQNVVLNASRLAPVKRQAMLISAYVKAREKCVAKGATCDYSLEIYGEGELKTELEDIVSRNNADKFITVNPTRADIYTQMNNSKIYVCSSSVEGYPNALLEAMAMGMAVISTNCAGSIEDMIEDGVNGLIVPVDDEAALTVALMRLMTNGDEAALMAAKAQNIRQTNCPEVLAEKWAAFFNEVIEAEERSERRK